MWNGWSSKRRKRQGQAIRHWRPWEHATGPRTGYGVEPPHGGALDDLGLQHRYPERPLPPILLRDVHPTSRLCAVRPTFQPIGEVSEVFFQCLPVVPPRLSVHARCGFLLEKEIS